MTAACSTLQIQLLLLHRLTSVFAFNFILSFKRQPYIMDQPVGWLIFNHKLRCRELDDVGSDLPVCLDQIRARVWQEVALIFWWQQLLEMLNWKHLFCYWCNLFVRWAWPDSATPAAIQVTQAPEYSGDDLNGASSTSSFPVSFLFGPSIPHPLTSSPSFRGYAGTGRADGLCFLLWRVPTSASIHLHGKRALRRCCLLLGPAN